MDRGVQTVARRAGLERRGLHEGAVVGRQQVVVASRAGWRAVALALLVAACIKSREDDSAEAQSLSNSGGDSGSGDSSATYTAIRANVFTAVCAVECHAGSSAPKGLRLDMESAYDLLVGVKSAEVPSLDRVKAFDPGNSYLMVKIVATDSRRSGDRMPRDGPPYLSDTQIDAIRTWIARGAPRD